MCLGAQACSLAVCQTGPRRLPLAVLTGRHGRQVCERRPFLGCRGPSSQQLPAKCCSGEGPHWPRELGRAGGPGLSPVRLGWPRPERLSLPWVPGTGVDPTPPPSPLLLQAASSVALADGVLRGSLCEQAGGAGAQGLCPEER